MERNVMWSPWDGPGLEHLHLVQDQRGISADGMILSIAEGRPFRAHYQVHCDPAWRVRTVDVQMLETSQKAIKLHADGHGAWTDEAGQPIPWLNGCIDVDISITPFTNTLPIRRLGLKPGESSAFAVVYIVLPEMEVKRDQQRYTCLDVSAEGGTYTFTDEGLFPGYTANLPSDADGVVLDYPDLFRRVWSDDL